MTSAPGDAYRWDTGVYMRVNMRRRDLSPYRLHKAAVYPRVTVCVATQTVARREPRIFYRMTDRTDWQDVPVPSGLHCLQQEADQQSGKVALTIRRPLLPYGYSVLCQTGLSGVVFCNFWHPGTLTLGAERQSDRMSKFTNDGLTRCGTGCFIAVYLYGKRQKCPSVCLSVSRQYWSSI